MKPRGYYSELRFGFSVSRKLKWHLKTVPIEEKLKEIPSSPGVYLHKDGAGRVIYVGKAKNLRSRVRSYFRARPFDRKTDALVGQIADFEFIVTDNEVEALI
ncbi:MAG TPA: GIY-YIG nuclease family protein, partial [Pyrinomonadaceae bacterium]